MARVLLIDNDADGVAIRRLLFEREGHAVSVALNVDDARKRFREIAPETVVLDLRIPNASDGLALIREFRAAAPDVRLIVLSGFTADVEGHAEAKLVDEIVPKPVRSARLMGLISRAAVLALMCFATLSAQSFRFQVQKTAEVVADLDMSAPGADWSIEGREASLAEVTVDGASPQHVMLYLGAMPHKYSIFLGSLPAGSHTLHVERRADYSAPEAKLAVAGASFREIGAGSDDYPVLAHSPVLFARANTVGKFTDVPMIVYAEKGVENGEPLLSYTVIFSNEDGGTSTRALMARWGRTTDVEYVYKAFLTETGELKRATMQARGHREIAFDGKMDGSHPMLIPSTDNNMVSGEGSSPIRYQIAPVLIDLSAHSREEIMDQNPWSYRVMADELKHEQKLRPFGTVDGQKVSDARNYLYIEARLTNMDAGVAFLVRLKDGQLWRSSSLGEEDYAISRSGWIRSTIELPPGTRANQIAEIGFECIVVRQNNVMPVAGTCRVDDVSKMFLLDSEYRPQPTLWKMSGSAEFPTGAIVSYPR